MTDEKNCKHCREKIEYNELLKSWFHIKTFENRCSLNAEPEEEGDKE